MAKVSLALGQAQGRGDFGLCLMDSKAVEGLAITGILPFILLSRAYDYLICGQNIHAANKC